MKLYIVVTSYPYEGYDAPEGIFSTFEAAENYMWKRFAPRSVKRKKRPENVDIMEYELDNPDFDHKYR